MCWAHQNRLHPSAPSVSPPFGHGWTSRTARRRNKSRRAQHVVWVWSAICTGTLMQPRWWQGWGETVMPSVSRTTGVRTTCPTGIRSAVSVRAHGCHSSCSTHSSNARTRARRMPARRKSGTSCKVGAWLVALLRFTPGSGASPPATLPVGEHGACAWRWRRGLRRRCVGMAERAHVRLAPLPRQQHQPRRKLVRRRTA